MNRSVFQEISKIIERDSKDTTYKFALLRGTIEIIQSKSPFIGILGDRVEIPLGLMVERWLVYYYPLIDAEKFIPQKNGEKDKPSVRLAFRPLLKKLTEYYKLRGGFSSFYNDLVYRGIPQEIEVDFISLCRKINNTITGMPMKYIGRSVFPDYYSLFTPYKKKFKNPKGKIDLNFLIHAFGKFRIPKIYYEVFSFLGSYISGMEGILFQWATFTVNASNQNLRTDEVLAYLLTSPAVEREVDEVRKFYKAFSENQGSIECVWTGRSIRKFDVDHIIPFTAWKNNNLWNLLPSSPKANNQKRDKIPSIELLKTRKERIIYYWEVLESQYPNRFQQEINISLLGSSKTNWQLPAFEKLTENCQYLIDIRGYEAWQP